jgi:hypothetical protein
MLCAPLQLACAMGHRNPLPPSPPPLPLFCRCWPAHSHPRAAAVRVHGRGTHTAPRAVGVHPPCSTFWARPAACPQCCCGAAALRARPPFIDAPRLFVPDCRPYLPSGCPDPYQTLRPSNCQGRALLSLHCCRPPWSTTPGAASACVRVRLLPPVPPPGACPCRAQLPPVARRARARACGGPRAPRPRPRASSCPAPHTAPHPHCAWLGRPALLFPPPRGRPARRRRGRPRCNYTLAPFLGSTWRGDCEPRSTQTHGGRVTPCGAHALSACRGRCSSQRAPAACPRARPWRRPWRARPWPSSRAP